MTAIRQSYRVFFVDGENNEQRKKKGQRNKSHQPSRKTDAPPPSMFETEQDKPQAEPSERPWIRSHAASREQSPDSPMSNAQCPIPDSLRPSRPSACHESMTTHGTGIHGVQHHVICSPPRGDIDSIDFNFIHRRIAIHHHQPPDRHRRLLGRKRRQQPRRRL